MIEQATIAQLRKLYQNLRDEPLERTDPRYVQLFEDPRLSSVDPVARLSRCIQFAGRGSSQLFSGHRGTGKSTQLLRLEHELEQVADYKVVVCDMEKYLPMTDEVEVVDATFRARIRERMKLHVGAFKTEVHEFVESCVKALRKRHGSDTQLVVIYAPES